MADESFFEHAARRITGSATHITLRVDGMCPGLIRVNATDVVRAAELSGARIRVAHQDDGNTRQTVAAQRVASNFPPTIGLPGRQYLLPVVRWQYRTDGGTQYSAHGPQNRAAEYSRGRPET